MSSYRGLALLIILFTACRSKTSSLADTDKTFPALVRKANDEKTPMPERLAATQSATQFARQHNDISKEIESINERGILYWKIDSPDQAIAHFKTAAQMARHTTDTAIRGAALNNIGLLMGERSLYDSAICYYQQADSIFRTTKDSIRLVQCDINIGIAYKNLGAFEKAFAITIDAAHMMENMNASLSLATAYNTLGTTLKDLHRPQEALLYHDKALSIRQRLNDSIGIAQSLNNIGNVYKTNKEYARAIPFFIQSLDIKRRVGTKKSRTTTIDNLAAAYLGLEQYDLAEQYQREELNLQNPNNDKDGWMSAANTLARIYLARNRLDSAQSLATSIAATADHPIYLRQQMENALLLRSIYVKKKDYPNASRYADIALTLKDSLFNSDMSTAISQMNARFHTAEQQKALSLAEKNAIIQSQQINTQRTFIIFLTCFILLLSIISYLLYVSSRLRKKARERTELFMKELNHRVKNNLQLAADILNLQTLTTNDPKQLEFIGTARNRIQSIGIVHNLLYKGEYTGTINMSLFIAEITRNISMAWHDNVQQIRTSFSHNNIPLDADQAIPLGLIINELITNIYKYNPADARQLLVDVQLSLDKENFNLRIIDTGSPWDLQAARREKKGIGLLLIDMLTRQLKASWQATRNGQENIQYFSFPKA